MSLFRRNEIWYASYSLPGGKRIKESLGTKGQAASSGVARQAKSRTLASRKARDLPDVTFEEACLRWFEEKADKNLSIQIKAGLSSGLNILRV